MKLRYFKAERYRSLREFGIDVDDFMVLLGENNCGKSNFFYALDLFLSSTTKGVDANSFFNRNTSEPIVLTARFDNLTAPEMEKLAPWTVNGELTVSKEYSSDDVGKITTNYFALMRVPAEPCLNEEFEHYDNRDVVNTLPIAPFLPTSGRITKAVYKQAISQYMSVNSNSITYRDERRKSPAGYKQVLDGYLPELHLVQAVKEATEATKTSTTADFGKLLGHIVRHMTQFNTQFQPLKAAIDAVKRAIEGDSPDQKMSEISELETKIQEALLFQDVKVSISVDPPDVDRLFQLGTTLTLDDGVLTGIDYKGHGLQRSLIFALIRVWAAESKKPIDTDTSVHRVRSCIFAFEEPELFLHPQMCRATYDALKEISNTDQILLCTHSSHFVNLDDYKSMALLKKPSFEDGTKATRVREDLFEGNAERKQRFNMSLFFNPDRNEVFFARKVVLLEGATEKAVIPLVARRLGLFNHGISLIDCAGKFNLVLYMKVLNAFQIPYLAIYDEDPIPKGLEPGGQAHDSDKYDGAKRTFQENQTIEDVCSRSVGRTKMVPGEFDDILNISTSHAEKVGKPYAAVDHYSDEQTSIPPAIQELVKEIYDLPR